MGLVMTLSWSSLISERRFFVEDQPPQVIDGHYRSTEYQFDVQRIVTSSAFRRLQGKTQVFTPSSHRLRSHSISSTLEVSQDSVNLASIIAHALARADRPNRNLFGVIPDIVEAACLAHDIGNPPFGHAGEYAIQSFFKNEKLDFLKNANKKYKTFYILMVTRRDLEY